MKKRLMFALLAGGLVVAMVPGVVTAADAPWDYADIDSNGDCTVDLGTGEATQIEREPGQVNVAINANWIIATCHLRLDTSEVADLGGPFRRAQVYRDFDCLVGDDDDLDDIEATSSHAVVTPSSRMTIVCKAPYPDVVPG